jgi:hypothetical protein
MPRARGGTVVRIWRLPPVSGLDDGQDRPLGVGEYRGGTGCRAGWMLVRIECVLVRNPYPEIRAYGVYGQTVI